MPFFITQLIGRSAMIYLCVGLSLLTSTVIAQEYAKKEAAKGAGSGDPSYSYQPIDVGKADKPLHILILGGTGFTGRIR